MITIAGAAGDLRCLPGAFEDSIAPPALRVDVACQACQRFNQDQVEVEPNGHHVIKDTV